MVQRDIFRRLISWAFLRWLALGSALPLVWACGDRTIGAPVPNPSSTDHHNFPGSLNPKLDLLFMVDNSQSMASLQKKLVAQFPTFMDRLKIIPTADGKGTALPDVHVAVISSDTGPGVYDEANTNPNVPGRGCPFAGDRGQFQFAPQGTCTTSPLHAGQRFLSAADNEKVTNYDGNISDAFACIAALGDQGCGFEGQLKSVREALDPTNLPDTNVGFLRDDALLAVILITNEDDCSVPDDSTLFNSDPAATGTLGALWSYRCNQFGHLCNINGQLQPPPYGPATNLQGCVSNETDTGRLTKVGDEVAFLKSLKRDWRQQLYVAAITGIPKDGQYSVDMIQRQGEDPHPNIHPACGSSTGEFADPSVRINQWVESFGSNGTIQNICAPDNFKMALDSIAAGVVAHLDPACVRGTLQDKDASTPALDPQCTVIDHYVDADNHVHESTLHACAVDATLPCWSLTTNAMKCGADHVLDVTRAPGALPDNLRTLVSCVTCPAGVTRAGCP